MAQFDGRPGALPITAYYKGDFALQFSFTSGGSAYSLVGASATFVIYERNGTAALSLSSGSGLTISGAAGTIELDITNAQIVALATQEYNYEMIVTLSGGTVWPVLDSVFNVSDSGQSSYSGSTVEVALDGGTVTLTIAPANALPIANVVVKTADFDATEPTGVIYTNTGAGNFITGTLQDDPIGTQRTFTPDMDENGESMGILTVAGITALMFNAGTITVTSAALGYVAAGSSVTFTKITDTIWQATAQVGEVGLD